MAELTFEKNVGLGCGLPLGGPGILWIAETASEILDPETSLKIMDKIKLNNFNTKLVIEMNGPSKISVSLAIKGNLEIVSQRRNSK